MLSSTDRLLGVLTLFTSEPEGLTVEQAAKKLNLPISTVYRYFRSLAQVELISAYAPGRYLLGSAVIEYDRQMRLLDPLITTAQPAMARLTNQFSSQHVVLLCRLYKTQAMCVLQEFRERPRFAVSYERGRLMQLHRGAASKIILAYLPLRITKAYHEQNQQDMARCGLGPTREDLKRQLRALRNAGYAETEGELDPGMGGLAVPILGPDKGIIGSLGVVAVGSEWRDPHAISLLIGARREIEEGLIRLDAKTKQDGAAASDGAGMGDDMAIDDEDRDDNAD